MPPQPVPALSPSWARRPSINPILISLPSIKLWEVRFMSSEFGKLLRISVFGQSHGRAIGVNIDGLPAGESIDLQELDAFLDRRKPGKSPLSTTRKESDAPILSLGLSMASPAVRRCAPSSKTATSTLQITKSFRISLGPASGLHRLHQMGRPRGHARRWTFLRKAHGASLYRRRHCQTDSLKTRRPCGGSPGLRGRCGGPPLSPAP